MADMALYFIIQIVWRVDDKSNFKLELKNFGSISFLDGLNIEYARTTP